VSQLEQANRSRAAARLSQQAQIAEQQLRKQIGSRLRERRQHCQLSGQQLAELASVTRSFIFQIEHGQVTPSFSTALRITHALGITLSDLLEAPPPSQTEQVLRPEDWSIYHYPEDVTEDAVLWSDPAQRLEVIWSRFPAGASTNTVSTDGNIVHGASIEFVLILRGQIQLQINDRQHLLDERCSITFDGRTPHHWTNPTTQPAELIALVIRDTNTS
jgi:transcriptional regulator with XRE-family HTH domain